MQVIIGLIFAVIGIYVFTSIATPSIESATEVAEQSGASGVAGLMGIIPIIFVAMIIFGVVKTMGGEWGSGEKTVTVRLVKNAKSLIITIKEESQKLEQYLNNLDNLLGIKTVVDDEPLNDYGLRLKDGNLYICNGDKTWDWYITDKHPTMNIFKVVGLHKKDQDQNLAYILGKNSDDGDSYLIKISKTYVSNASIKECITYAGIKKENREVMSGSGVT